MPAYKNRIKWKFTKYKLRNLSQAPLLLTSLSLEVTVNDLGFIFYMFICAYIHLITYTPPWRPFLWPLSWRSVPRLFFSDIQRVFPCTESLSGRCLWKCVVLIHMVIDFRAHCWTTGQFCSLLSDIRKHILQLPVSPLSLLSIQVARKILLKSMSNRISSSLRIFKISPFHQ